MDEEVISLSMELLETLYIVAKRFFEYTDKYHLAVDGLDSLSLLTRRAEALMKELGSPHKLRSDPIRPSDESSQGDGSDDKATAPFRGATIRWNRRFLCRLNRTAEYL